jgi:D-glycero-D-manno-heptose 1,7-bisphosphate phosphatase
LRARRKPARGKPVRRGAARRPPFDALFLDRDGTLVVERGFLGDPKDIRLAAGAAERLRIFAREGTALFIVTNQSGLARGFLTRSQVDSVNAEIVRRYAARGVHFAGVLVCPHHPEGAVASLRRRCRCRKPGTLLHERALRACGLSARRSAVVGDKWDDVGSGLALGAATAHVLTGHGRRERPLVLARAPGAILATTLADALDQLLSRAPRGRPSRRSA